MRESTGLMRLRIYIIGLGVIGIYQVPLTEAEYHLNASALRLVYRHGVCTVSWRSMQTQTMHTKYGAVAVRARELKATLVYGGREREG